MAEEAKAVKARQDEEEKAEEAKKAKAAADEQAVADRISARVKQDVDAHIDAIKKEMKKDEEKREEEKKKEEWRREWKEEQDKKKEAEDHAARVGILLSTNDVRDEWVAYIHSEIRRFTGLLGHLAAGASPMSPGERSALVAQFNDVINLSTTAMENITTLHAKLVNSVLPGQNSSSGIPGVDISQIIVSGFTLQGKLLMTNLKCAVMSADFAREMFVKAEAKLEKELEQDGMREEIDRLTAELQPLRELKAQIDQQQEEADSEYWRFYI
ncbi:MAG: hypothetical protein Q9169_007145 [Polycauliona sp. 2 TL-2023]